MFLLSEFVLLPCGFVLVPGCFVFLLCDFVVLIGDFMVIPGDFVVVPFVESVGFSSIRSSIEDARGGRGSMD